MTDDERLEWALSIAQEVLENVEFSTVYEEEDLEDVSEDDLQDIHDKIIRDLKVVRYER